MNFGVAFLIIGAIIILVEIFSFTIYLIAIGIAFWIGGAFFLNDFSVETSLYATGISMLIGLIVAHMIRKKLKNPESDRVSDDDVGNSVIVTSLSLPELRVDYRGTHWSAQMENSEETDINVGDRLFIVKRRGNLLFLTGSKPD